MNLIQFLAMKLQQGTSVYLWYGKFNRGPSSLQSEFLEGRLKSVVVPESIDSVRQRILRDRQVPYRWIQHISININYKQEQQSSGTTHGVSRSHSLSVSFLHEY